MSGALPNEGERLKALFRYRVLDTLPEPEFDRIVAQAAAVLACPMATLSLVDADRVWFKARQGLATPEIPRAESFCAHTLQSGEIFVVENAPEDARFRDIPLVAGAPGIRFYAGAPLRTPDGYVIGALSVLDVEPRGPLGEEQASVLRALADLAVHELELRVLVRRAAERDKEKQEGARLFSRVFDAAPLGLAVTDESGRIMAANRALSRILGSAEIAGQPLSMILPAGLDAESRVVRADGSTVPVRALTAPLAREDGGTWNVTALIDLTEGKQREDRARRADKIDALSRMAGKIAHDFNNILMIINGFGQLIKSSVDARDPMSGFADEILKATTRASVITGRFLLFSGRRVGKAQTVDLNSTVSSIASLVRQSAGQAIEVVTNLDPALSKVSADAGHLGQVVMNLAENAKDAMPAGGRLSIETSNVEIGPEQVRDYPGAKPGPYVLLRVADTGTGMDPEAQARLFEPFFTTKGASRGTGLAAVYGIAKHSGGFVDFESRPGEGAVASVYLPALASPKPPRPKAPAVTVLLVDYDDSARRPVRMMLEEHGYRVLEAANADQAIEVAEAHQGPIHLLITEVVIPGRTGTQLAAQLRASRPEIKVLYTSAHGMVEEALPEGEAPFLRKPLSADALGAKLREILGEHSQGF